MGVVARVKITMVRRVAHDDLLDKYVDRERVPEAYGLCQLWTVGQEFTVDWHTMPEGFPCDRAWVDIQPSVAMLLHGADAPWIKQPGTLVKCCSDGLRPVTFVLERIEG